MLGIWATWGKGFPARNFQNVMVGEGSRDIKEAWNHGCIIVGWGPFVLSRRRIRNDHKIVDGGDSKISCGKCKIPPNMVKDKRMIYLCILKEKPDSGIQKKSIEVILSLAYWKTKIIIMGQALRYINMILKNIRKKS